MDHPSPTQAVNALLSPLYTHIQYSDCAWLHCRSKVTLKQSRELSFYHKKVLKREFCKQTVFMGVGGGLWGVIPGKNIRGCGMGISLIHANLFLWQPSYLLSNRNSINFSHWGFIAEVIKGLITHVVWILATTVFWAKTVVMASSGHAPPPLLCVPLQESSKH